MKWKCNNVCFLRVALEGVFLDGKVLFWKIGGMCFCSHIKLPECVWWAFISCFIFLQLVGKVDL